MSTIVTKANLHVTLERHSAIGKSGNLQGIDLVFH
jgi:hypothetical protein